MSIICPIREKGNVLACSYYRGVSSLYTFYKLFFNLLFNGFAVYIDNIIGDHQCGFLRGRSTVEQIFKLKTNHRKDKNIWC